MQSQIMTGFEPLVLLAWTVFLILLANHRLETVRSSHPFAVPKSSHILNRIIWNRDRGFSEYIIFLKKY